MKEKESKPAFDPKLYFKPNTIATTCPGRSVRRGEAREGMERKRDDRLEEKDFGGHITREKGTDAWSSRFASTHGLFLAWSAPAVALFQRRPTNAASGHGTARRSAAPPSHRPAARPNLFALLAFRVLWRARSCVAANPQTAPTPRGRWAAVPTLPHERAVTADSASTTAFSQSQRLQ